MRTSSLNRINGFSFVVGAIALGCSSNGPSADPPGETANGGANSSSATAATGGDSQPTKGSSSHNTSSVERGGSSTGGTSATQSGDDESGGSDAATGGVTTSTGVGSTKGGAAAGGANTGRGGASSGAKTGSGGGATGGKSGSSNATGGQATAGSTGAGSDPVKSEGCGKTPSLKSGKALSITVSGSARTYNLKVPDNYDNTHPYRLIMSYHWLGGTADNVSDGGVAKPYYGLWDLAGGSTIFVAPQGLKGSMGLGWENKSGADVEFSRQLITLMESEFCIDKSRIFCEGFSMGGSMSYAMACGMGDVIRAVAAHSGGTMSGCAKHDKPVAYFMTHGTKDSVCTYPSFPMPPLMDFAKLNGCTDPDPSLSQSAFEALLPEPTSTAAACIDFKGCKAEYPVRSCLFVGDHTPSPDGTNGWVPKETWKFFSQF
ncbi:MAG TPA: hypothetical protein VKP30_22720 [Polyangiaceae bacterium]|nr:hypothetical protein [Polyangiaceae bacterium]